MEVPVQLHLSDDNRFMPNLLASDKTHTGQGSGSDSSIHDSDCDALVNSPPAKASSSGHSAVNKKNVCRTRLCQTMMMLVNRL